MNFELAMDSLQRLKHIAETWYLTEPLYFGIYCTHQLTENTQMPVALRTGHGRVEYNPQVLDTLSNDMTEQLMRVEMVRVMLRHPYQRQPYNAQRQLMHMASDITVADNLPTDAPIASPESYGLESGKTFEAYYAAVSQLMQQSSCEAPQAKGDGESQPDDDEQQAEQHAAGAELWQEDELMNDRISHEIEKARDTASWGSVPGHLKGLIEATLVSKQNFRAVLSRFRHTVLSSKRRLTRMQPNRRYGFEAMGSRHSYATRLLVAVDTSGSVSDHQLARFLAVINRFFTQGVECINVIEFDHELQTPEPIPLKKAARHIVIRGRGGTSFQPAVDFYYGHPEYDGLIILTDGYAPCPTLPDDQPHRPLVWMLTTAECHLEPELRRIGETCHIEGM